MLIRRRFALPGRGGHRPGGGAGTADKYPERYRFGPVARPTPWDACGADRRQAVRQPDRARRGEVFQGLERAGRLAPRWPAASLRGGARASVAAALADYLPCWWKWSVV